MNTNPENQQKFLINCQDGANNIERASIAFVLAASASKTAVARVFATADAAHLCVKGGTDGMIHDGMEPIADLMAQFMSNGGVIWLCPICAKTKGIAQEDLIEGVEIAGAPKTMEFLADGAHLLA